MRKGRGDFTIGGVGGVWRRGRGEIVEELKCGFVVEGMEPVGPCLGEGEEDKLAEMHARVWNGEGGCVDNERIDGYDVDVDEAVGIRAVGVAVGDAGEVVGVVVG